MANAKDCAICKQMMKEKHKLDKFYRIGFWVLLVLFLLIIALYCATGDVFTVTENNKTIEIENNSNIDIENGNNNHIEINSGGNTIS